MQISERELETEAERQRHERDAELAAVPLSTARKGEWPEGVRSVGLKELDKLGVDDAGRLYWDGQPVEVIKHHLVLTSAQGVWAVFIALFTFLAAAGAIVQGFVAGHDWLCRANWVVTWCAL